MTSDPNDSSTRPDTPVSTFRPASKRICLVTGELGGPDYNGGIGTAVRGLALALARHGHQVDILYTRVDRQRPFCFRGTFEEQVEAFRRSRIRLMCISHDGEWNDWLAKSYQVMMHLGAHRYDHVFFNDMHGAGYYSQLARKTASPLFEKTTMAVVLHSATQWVTELNQGAVTSVEDVRLMEMERRSIELADAVISPSAYMLKKYREYGWQLPANTCVLPNLLPTRGQRQPEIQTLPVDEIVFFGRLERRKGLWLFCDALSRIKHEIGPLKVTFLGKMTEEDGELTGFPLLRRSAAWPFEVQILHNFDREQALNYLKAGRRAAIMPAWQDNSPCAILECLYEGIPFAASSGSGGQELIAETCWATNLFEPTVESLSQKLRAIMRDGAATALPATDPDQNEKAVLDWLEQTVEGSPASQGERTTSAASPVRSEQAISGRHLLVTTSQLDPVRDVADIERLVELHAADARITILARDPVSVTERLPSHLSKAAVTSADVRDFGEIIQSLATESSVIGVCHVTQPITSDWLARAERCLREVREISALTGMAAIPEDDPKGLPPYFSVSPVKHRVREFRIGNSPVMFSLGLDTNSGFIAIRPELAETIRDISPFDRQYEQFKGMQDWVHEMVVRLHEHGRRFEVLADRVLDGALGDQPSPVFRLGRTVRSLMASHLDHAPGSEQALLARLATETMIGAGRRRAAGECLSYLSEKLGRRLEDPSLYATQEETSRTLAAMAQASGQTELAHELSAERLLWPVGRDHKPRPLASAVRRIATEIRLFDLAAAGAFTGFNLSHEWSFKVMADDREIEIHPNTSLEGRAGITFHDLDLTNVGFLCGAVRLASPYSQPVRFRVDIMSVDGTSYFGLDRVARASEVVQLEEQLPLEISTRCDVSLSTEMASPSHQTEGAWARWTDIRLAVA